MSDQQPPPDPYGSQPSTNPYTAPPPPANPYGTAAPPAGGLTPHPYDGGTPQHQAPYGQQYGAPAQRDPDARPGTVLAAVVITLIFSVLSALGLAAGLLGLLVARDTILDQLRNDATLSAYDGDQIVTIAAIALAVILFWCLAAIVLSVLVLRGSNLARILLVVSSGFTALISLLAILSGVSVITLIASIAVIVLLFTGGAGPWFARKTGAPQPPVGTSVY